jgi:DinB superfamily
MEPRIAPLAEILRLNTVLFRNCLDSLTEEQASRRPSGATNNASFIAAHLASSRFFLLKTLGVDEADPLARYLDGRKGIDDIAELPPLREVDAAWTKGAHLLRDRLPVLTTADLDAPSSFKFPLANGTLLGTLTFLVQHDSYHLGQLSLLRRYCGLPAMTYTNTNMEDK